MPNKLVLGDQESEPVRRIGLFDADGIRFGIDILHVAEVALAGQLLPLVSTRSEVIGALDLRGQIIPVLDPLIICGLERSVQAPRVVAILVSDTQLVGLAFNETKGISGYAPSAFQTLYRSLDTSPRVIQKNVLDQGCAINIIETKEIFSQSDIPTVTAQENGGYREGTSSRGAYLTFTAGGATFGLEATRIFSTVPRQKIEVGAISGGRCLGIIRHLNRKIPVVACSEIIGIGTKLINSAPEVVIVRFSDNRLVGLAVDVIRRIQFINKNMLVEPPAHVPSAGKVVTCVYYQRDESQVFILDPGGLEEKDELNDLAKVSIFGDHEATEIEDASARNVSASRRADGQCSANRDIQTESKLKRYLVFKAGRAWAAELTDVISIIKYPQNITPINNGDPSVIGFLTHKQQSVMLVDLARIKGFEGTATTKRTRVLLVSNDEITVGLVVSHVEGIESSETRIQEVDGSVITMLPNKKMVDVLQLRSEAALVSRRYP